MTDLSSTGFSTQAVGQTLLTHRCRSSRINLEIAFVRNGFLFRHRIHPLCRVGWYLTAFIRLYQHSSDRWFRLCALSWRNRSLQRCSVISALSILVPPAFLLHVSPTFAVQTVSSKVLGFSIALTFDFAFLVFVFVLSRLCCFQLSCLCLCLYLSCRLCLSCLFLLLPSIERSMGTASPAAVSACARQ